MTYIIETIGSWGVRTTDWRYRTRPRPGDLVRFREQLRRYPISHEMCRIDTVSQDEDRVTIVDGMGSCFLNKSGEVSISGGPFFGLPLGALEATHTLEVSMMWNWGDNLPGAGQGVEYRILRPVWNALRHPDHYLVRYARSEAYARRGGVFKDMPVPESARRIFTSEILPEMNGERLYRFELETNDGRQGTRESTDSTEPAQAGEG